ncbi:MAG: hypothetical protein A3H02_02965 [Candidatus Niyogibacteria bacterium RIFCSPLOWO2_12_FULL_41_13]|uniref:Uncharacterized protein n=1 Tax=Candidatus Niyogibacteria bacterium RIFCSPLOWO2_12_FULL_41_13 TaxID=1801726 RepID=A0A1G2F3P1_9BACT|nr:MAG: hypothetical protein A3H02_02965 [Candidatus Niyogibacteria bacterium RIFCSPLOWO2_12_FULL_41_13]
MVKIIEKSSIKIGKEPVVILPLKEYEKLQKSAIPTYYLKGKEAEELDKLVEEGLRDHGLVKTRKIKSLSDLD